MIARFSPSFDTLVTACFPVPGCTVGGYFYQKGRLYCVKIRPPQPFTGPSVYEGRGHTCYAALAAAVQHFHDSAHAFPDARPLAAPGSYSPPPQVHPFPHDDEPADEAERPCQCEMRLAHQQTTSNY